MNSTSNSCHEASKDDITRREQSFKYQLFNSYYEQFFMLSTLREQSFKYQLFNSCYERFFMLKLPAGVWWSPRLGILQPDPVSLPAGILVGSIWTMKRGVTGIYWLLNSFIGSKTQSDLLFLASEQCGTLPSYPTFEQ